MAGFAGIYSNASSKPWTQDSEYDPSKYQYGGFAGGAGDQAANYVNDASDASQRAAPTMQGTQLDQGAADQSRGFQMGSLASLQGAANGTAPSQAAILGQQMADKNAQQAVSSAGTVRGGPGAQASAYRYAANNAATQGAQAQQSIMADRANEMSTAQNNLANASSAARGQDLSAATTNAQLGQQTQQTNASNQLAQTGLNDQSSMGYQQLGNQVNEDQLNAGVQQQQIAAGVRQSGDALNTQTNQANTNTNKSVLSGVIGAGQGALSAVGSLFSDPSTKLPLMGSLATLGLGGKNDSDDGAVNLGDSSGRIGLNASTGLAAKQAIPGMVGGGGIVGGTMPVDESNVAGPGMMTSDPAAKEPYDTSLTPAKEKEFQTWKAQYAPHDSGADYDLRGAFAGGEKPGADGHWVDTYKKPNHPTFSDQSKYTDGHAGHWEGDNFLSSKQQSEAFLDRMGSETEGARPYERAREFTVGVAGAPRGYASGRGNEDDSVSWSKPETWGMNQKSKSVPSTEGQAPGSDDWQRYGAPEKTTMRKGVDGSSYAHTEGANEGEIDWGHGGEVAQKDAKPGFLEALFKGLGNARPFGASPQRDLTTSDPAAKRAAYLSGRSHGAESVRSQRDVPYAYAPIGKDEELVEVESGKPEVRPIAKPVSAAVGEAASGAHPPGALHAAGAAAYMHDRGYVAPVQGEAQIGPPKSPESADTRATREDSQNVGRLATLAAPLLGPAVGIGYSGFGLGLGVAAEQKAARDRAEAEQKKSAVASRDTTTSDPSAKDGFQRVPDADMAEAMRSMAPSVYAYKPDFAGKNGQKPGEANVGPMADEMAKDPVARTAIVRDPGSGMLAIDKSKAEKVIMGSLASLQHQLDELGNGEPRADGAKRRRRAEPTPQP